MQSEIKQVLPAFTGTLSTIPRDISVGYVIAIPKFNKILNAEIIKKVLRLALYKIKAFSASFYDSPLTNLCKAIPVESQQTLTSMRT